MIDAYSIEHHEYIDANFWFQDSRVPYNLLILHNERGVFLQKRIIDYGPAQWLPLCRHCGKIATQSQGYSCTLCTARVTTEAIKSLEAAIRRYI
jgi:hypothetical protein